MDITLNKQQEKAKDMIVEWFSNPDRKQCFVLTGYAGTGKTFLINYIVKEVLKLKPTEVAYVAPTGKAACVLIQKGAPTASTIHSLIYSRIEKEEKVEIEGKTVINKHFEFVRKPSIPNYKLIILDETSMVDLKVMKDLLRYGIPMICAGDLAQLPPIGEHNTLLDNPDYNLTEIMRQEEDNAIVKLATMARNKIPIRSGNYGNVIVIREDMLTPDQRKNLLLSADQVLCGTNKKRFTLNQEIKYHLGLDLNKLNMNEKIICLLNNWEKAIDEDESFPLVNGMIGTVVDYKSEDENLDLGRLSFQADFCDDICHDLIFDEHIFKAGEFRYDFHQKVYLNSDGSYQLKKYFEPIQKGETKEQYMKRAKEYFASKKNVVSSEQLNFFDTAYAISVHKSQGSEWNKVVVFDESRIFQEPEKWLYTAITRAREKLVIII